MKSLESRKTRRESLSVRLRSQYLRALTLLFITIVFYSPSFASDTPPFVLPPKKELSRIRSAIIYTRRGEIRLKLFPEEAPWHVANFKYLADKGFYNGLPFHMVRENYMIQTGTPDKRVNGGPGYTLPPEFSQHKHIAGTVSMVRKPDSLDRDHRRRSHGSQFRIMLAPNRVMDGQFSVFGAVVQGLDVARGVREGDVIERVVVFVVGEGVIGVR